MTSLNENCGSPDEPAAEATCESSDQCPEHQAEEDPAPRSFVHNDPAHVSYSLPVAFEYPLFALGDDQRAFERIYEDLFRRFQPDAWGCCLLYDAAVASVEMMRLRRWKMQVIRYMVPQTLDEVLKALVADEERRRLMAGWRACDAAIIDEIEELMSRGGQSLETLEALSYFKEIDKFRIIDQQIAETKKTRDNALFALERQSTIERRDDRRFDRVLRQDMHKGLIKDWRR